MAGRTLNIEFLADDEIPEKCEFPHCTEKPMGWHQGDGHLCYEHLELCIELCEKCDKIGEDCFI